MRHLKYFENNRNKIINFCDRASDIINYENELGEIEPTNSDILSTLGDLANEYNMTADDLRAAMKELSPIDSNMVGIILDDTIKETERLANAKYLLSKEDIRNIVLSFCDVNIPMDAIVEELEKNYKNKKES